MWLTDFFLSSVKTAKQEWEKLPDCFRKTLVRKKHKVSSSKENKTLATREADGVPDSKSGWL